MNQAEILQMQEELKHEEEVLKEKKRLLLKEQKNLTEALKDSIRETFGKRLRTARKKAGLTQVQISQELNIIQKSFSQYETGRTAPSMSTLVALAKKLNVSVDWLLGLSD